MNTIESLSIDDLDEILPIEQACHAFPSSKKVLASCFGGRYRNAKLLLDGQIVGFYLAELVIDELTLHDICICPSVQGRGFGKALFEHFLQTAEALNAVQLWLEVRPSNRKAVALYQSHGFDIAGVRKDYYPTENGREDALLMGCTLSFDFKAC